MAKKFINDNQGSAIVMVLVAIAFVGIIASMMMYGTFMNYQVKVTDYHAKENFYSAEMAMDEIRAGLQKHVNNAFSIAYMEALEDYGMDEVDRRSRLRQKYIDVLTANLQAESGKYDLAKLQGFLSQPLKAVVTSSEGQSMVSYTDGVRLLGITVTHTDEDGYVSIIDTDILLQIPELGLGNVYEYPEIMDCVLIANEKLTFTENATKANISGSVYGGKQGIVLEDNVKVDFSSYSNSKGETIPVNVVTDSYISLGKNAADLVSFHTDSEVTLWTRGIDVISSGDVLSLEGTSYVKDDLTIKANSAKIKLAGRYYGFGNRISKAEDSSSLIINGKDTTLDMEGLKEFILAGSAYIAASDLESGKDKDNNDNPDNEDIMTGSSVSSKAEQLAYLVPAEFVGYDMTEQKVIIGQNPVNVKDKAYDKFINETWKDNPQRYREVNLNLVDKKLGESLSNYGATYEKVFYQTADGTLWAYYYLKFMSVENANEFFQKYYANPENKELLNNYIGKYIKKLKLSDNLKNREEGFRLSLAGNMIEVDSDNTEAPYRMINSTDTGKVEEQISLSSEFTLYNNRFTGMCKKMSKDFFALDPEEVTSDIYHNLIVDENVITNLDYLSNTTRFDNAVTGAIALFIRREEEEEVPSLSGLAERGIQVDKVQLIITEGSMIVDRDFEGLIIAGNEIIVKGNVTLKASDKLPEVLVAKHAKTIGENVTETLALGLFKDGVYPKEDNEEVNKVEDNTYTAKNLIVYENWTKK